VVRTIADLKKDEIEMIQ